MYILLIITLSVLFALLSWRDLRTGLVLLAGLLPTYLLRVTIGQLPTTLLEIFIVTIIFIWLVKHKGWKINIQQLDSWTRAGMLILAAASFAVIVAPNTISAFGIWKAYFIEPFFIFLILRSTFKKNDYKKALTALAISGIALSLFAIFQYLTSQSIPVPWDIERRVTGIFDYPNALGLFLAPIVAASFVFLYKPDVEKKHELKSRIFWSTSALLGSIAILLAQTEAAIVAIPAALLLTFLFTNTVKSRKIAITGIAFAVLVFTLALPLTRTKLLLQDYSGNVRLAQWGETVELISANPAFGSGLNGYSEALRPYHDPKLYEIFQYPHNIILNIWSELGILGLFAFFWLFVLTLKEMKRENPSTLKLATFAALATMTIHGLVDVPYFKNDLSIMTWIFIAILASRSDKKLS